MKRKRLKQLSVPRHLSEMAAGHKMLRMMVLAALAAGPGVRHPFHKGPKTEIKGVSDQVVQEADLLAERAIIRKVRNFGFRGQILSEETLSHVKLIKGVQTLIADPLDGSMDFSLGNKDVPSIMLALANGKRIEMALVLNPLNNTWHYAVNGGGAYKNGKKMTVDHARNLTLDQSQVILNEHENKNLRTEIFEKTLRAVDSGGAKNSIICNPNSTDALKILDSNLDIGTMIHENSRWQDGSGKWYVKQGPWDIAPILLIMQEAGAIVSRLDGKEVDLMDPQPLFMAANKKIADNIIRLATGEEVRQFGVRRAAG